MSDGTCPTCGRARDEHDRHLRLHLPDAALAVPEAERPERFWGNAELLAVRDLGCYVRVLLPIPLTDGYSITLGTWLSVEPPAFEAIVRAWHDPAAYAALEVDGRLANGIPPWMDEVLDAPAHASVRTPGQFPFVDGSEHPLLRHVLHHVWPHEELLEVYAAYE